MGITNIHILTGRDEPRARTDLILNHVVELRIKEHQRGDHTWGNMRRDCPLCQEGK